MIDIHTHILPDIDDGVTSTQEAIKILKRYQSLGVKAVCLTPHYAPNRGYHEEKSEINKRFKTFLTTAKKQDVTLDIYLGSEIDYHDNFLDTLPLACTINDTAFVLLDFGQGVFDIEEIIYELKLKSLNVIVAHSERYRYISLDAIKSLKKMGGIIQVNAKHFLKKGSRFSQKRALKLLKADLIDIVSSDIHTLDNVLDMKKAYQFVTKKTNKAYADKLFLENPKKVLGIE